MAGGETIATFEVPVNCTDILRCEICNLMQKMVSAVRFIIEWSDLTQTQYLVL